MEKRTLSNFIKNTQTHEEEIKLPAEGMYIIKQGSVNIYQKF